MIDSKTIEKVVYDLCVEANTKLPDDVFAKILDAYNLETNEDAKQALGLILENAQMAYEKKMPLCQDTGQVLVFVKGKDIPSNIKEIVNNAVSKAYDENFYRKSVIKNAFFDRTNTKTNTPCVVYTEVTEGEIEIDLLLKGGGSENVCDIKMLSPTASKDEIVEYAVSVIKKAGAKACPPYFLGIGIGGTIEYAGFLSKKALFLKENIDQNHQNLAEKIRNAVNKLEIGAAGLGGASTALDVKILTGFTHIASMPVAVTVNCHSTRHAGWRERGKEGKRESRNFALQNSNLFNCSTKVHTSDIETLKSLMPGQNILLSGEIYTARDMAHKRLIEMIENKEDLPFDLKNKIIFYAGPCPCKEPCVVGSIGPTTASRMDKYAAVLYEKGVLATIGKGERSEEIKIAAKQNGGLYFTAIGGIACYLAQKFVKKELIAFEDLGTEAIYRFEVKDLPLRVAF